MCTLHLAISTKEDTSHAGEPEGVGDCLAPPSLPPMLEAITIAHSKPNRFITWFSQREVYMIYLIRTLDFIGES